MLKKIHPLGKYAQGMHEKAEQEEEQRRQDDAKFFCAVWGIPTFICWCVLIYFYF